MNGPSPSCYCDKAHANLLTALMVAHGVRDVVVCPGSRNGALAHDFHVCPSLRCHPVTDERSAAFVAIGLIEATRRTVAVCVTSGSALLATLPAAAEAFYRHLPLLVVSADRPPEWIGQLDGQTLRQQGALRPYAETFTLPEIHDEATRWQADHAANEALLTARRGTPAHINVPLTEPLFSFTTRELPAVHAISEIRPEIINPLPKEWTKRVREARLPVLVIGQYEGEPLESLPAIERADSLLVLPELLANVPNAWRTATLEHAPELADLRPDLVLHAGGNFVNKRLKLHLRGLSGCPVLRIGEADGLPDTFRHLCAVVRSPLPPVLRQLADLAGAKPEVREWKAWLEEARLRDAGNAQDSQSAECHLAASHPISGTPGSNLEKCEPDAKKSESTPEKSGSNADKSGSTADFSRSTAENSARLFKNSTLGADSFTPHVNQTTPHVDFPTCGTKSGAVPGTCASLTAPNLENTLPTPPDGTLHSPLPTQEEKTLLSPLSSLHSENPLSALEIVQACCRRLARVPGVSLHLGNSMTVRHAARCLAGGEFPVHCNRGVNGIEGSLSAAAGHSLAWPGLTVAMLGDLSFFYDQNALWNERLDGRLRILVLNNGGGGIFHRLPGLDASAALPGLIDGAHRRTTAGVAETFGLRRMEIRRPADVEAALSLLLTPVSDRPILIEAFTS